MFNKLIKEKYYCGLDIGSQRIKAAILKVKDASHLEVLATSVNKIYGFKENDVIDLAEFSECVNSILTHLTKRAEVKIKEVQVGLSSHWVEPREINTVIPLTDRGSKVITQRDINKANHQARLLALKMDEELLHELPQSYRADEVNSIVNPLGLSARKLGVHSLMMVTNITAIQNLLRAIAQAGFDVGPLCLSSYMAADMVLNEEDKKEGCILVDMGAKVTTVLIFKDQGLKYISKINMGGNHLTENIARSLNLPFDVAEEIKKSYASAAIDQQHMSEEILIKKEFGFVPIKRQLVIEAVTPFLEQWSGLLQESFKTSSLFEELRGGIIFIGGGVLLSGLLENISQRIALPVGLGKIHIPSLKNAGNPCLTCSAVGLAYRGYQKSLRYVLSKDTPLSWRKNLTGKLKELYEDYF